ncbi:hypothetical protein ZWY2020_045237 [Hordeum vulgare]|nr:hypothetical protein ZWY2020_045237 [Hordeum vulgare]
MAAHPLRPEAEEGSKGAEVCLFDQSPEDFSRAVRAISELATGDPQPGFPDAEVERLASSVTFLREWRHFSYEPKGVSFVYGAGSASSGDDAHEITLPQFSSASFPRVTHLEDGRDKNADSSDFILFAGGSVWSLDWCPKLCDKPCSPVNCEYLAVAAHPPGSSYHKLGMPLIGRGIIQVWCLVAPFEEADPHQYSKSNRRGRPRKIPDENNSIESSSVPRKPIGRPRKMKVTTTDDHTEPSLKKPRGRPRKIEPATTDDHTEPSWKKPRKIKSAAADDYTEPSLKKPRGRPRKIEPSTTDDHAEPSLKKPRGRPRKIKPATTDDHAEPSLKKPRGRPRKTKCNVHLSAASSDATSPAHGLCNANYKEESSAQHRKKPVSTECSSSTTFSSEEQNNQPTPKPSDSVASVENCKKELLVYTRRRVRPPTKKSAPNETCSLVLSGDVQKMETSYTSIMPNNHLSSVENPQLLGSSISEDMANEAGLVVRKSAVVNHEVMEMNDSDAANQVVHAPFEDSAQMIVEVENTEVAPIEKSSKNDNIITCAENSNLSAIPEGIHLPRVVLCLAHNGKVAWDIKWKPPLPNQSERKSRLGFLAVLLGNGSLEVWEVPSPSIIQKIYPSSLMKGTDPRFLKLRPVFRCAKVKCRNIQSIPLTVDWSPSPHDMILAGCHDGTVALWKFSTDLPAQDSKPFMCVTAESVPIRALSWAPCVSEENTNTFVTAGEDGLKFWDLRDPYRPLWELTTAPKAVISLHWLNDARGIVISLEDGTLKFLSLPTIANDVPVTGRPFAGTKTQGVHTYQLSEYLIWDVHVSEITGHAAYCVADGTAVHFQLTSRFWEKKPRRNRVPYFLCGSLAEEGTAIKIGSSLQSSPLSNVPMVMRKGPESCQDVDQADNMREEELLTLANSEHVDSELGDGELDEGQETGALVLADALMQENDGMHNGPVDEKAKDDFEVFPPKAVALHRLRWNTNRGSERWLCYGGAAGIVRCQRI